MAIAGTRTSTLSTDNVHSQHDPTLPLHQQEALSHFMLKQAQVKPSPVNGRSFPNIVYETFQPSALIHERV